MIPSEPSDTERDNRQSDHRHSRRHVLLVGAATSAALLAGCTGGSETSDETTEPVDDTTSSGGSSPATGGDGRTGSFRLLISDQPAAIDDFDSLDVSFDSARLFRQPLATETETEIETETTATTEPTPSETDTETETDDAADGDRGFSIIDLDGRTVDLTQLVGEKASAVFDGELPEGRYTKIELSVADVVGVVDGERVAVKVPSEKLQITKPFTLRAGEPLDFVFDITVIKKGPNGYNLLPVISESGVAGKDVEMDEVDSAAPEASGSSAEAANETTSTETGTETETSGSQNGDSGAESGAQNGNPSENGGKPDDA